jgi:DNA-binding PucR family transcriptional regulator
VRWVHISELLDPTPWLSGGELLLTTGLALDGPERRREYIATPADHGLAGLGLGTGFTHDTVPAALVEAAAERGLPLFEVPYEVPFIALTRIRKIQDLSGRDLSCARDRIELWVALRGREIVTHPTTDSEVHREGRRSLRDQG